MKKVLFALLFCLCAGQGFGQSKLVSYEDIVYLLNNNIAKADTFFVSKDYMVVKRDLKKNTRQFSITMPGGTYNNVSLRTDGRRMYMELETNELQQYNLIFNSIKNYVNETATTVDVQAFAVKDLGNIYLLTNDVSPDPLKKLYTFQIVSGKNITSYN